MTEESRVGVQVKTAEECAELLYMTVVIKVRARAVRRRARAAVIRSQAAIMRSRESRQRRTSRNEDAPLIYSQPKLAPCEEEPKYREAILPACLFPELSEFASPDTDPDPLPHASLLGLAVRQVLRAEGFSLSSPLTLSACQQKDAFQFSQKID